MPPRSRRSLRYAQQAYEQWQEATLARIEESLFGFFRGIFRRMVSAIVDQLSRRDIQDADSLIQEARRIWSGAMSQIQDRIRSQYESVFEESSNRLSEMFDASATFDRDRVADVAAQYIRDAENRLVNVPDDMWESISITLADGYREGDSPQQLRDRVRRVVNDPSFTTHRASRIARTESTAVFNSANLDSMRRTEANLGQPLRKSWVATLDTRVRDAHEEANGQIVDSLVTPFIVNGERLQFPGDPSGSPGNVINCRCKVSPVPIDLVPGITDEDIERARERVNRNMAASSIAGQVDQVQTGSMIALIPSSSDRERLVLEDGEPSDELHLTLWFLGEAEDISEELRESVIEMASGVASSTGPIWVNAFGAAIWNPESDFPARVLNIGDAEGSSLELERGKLMPPMTFPVQHSPFSAHITIQYANNPDLSDLVERLGPIQFDAIRVAFGVEHVDLPLNGSEVEEPMSDDDMTATMVAAVVGDLDLPIADRDREWDGGAAGSRVLEWATDDDGNVDGDRLARAFLWRDDDANPDTLSAYKLGFADVIDGMLTMVPRGVFATAGGRGVDATTGISSEDKDRIKSRINTLYERLANSFDDDSIVSPFVSESDNSSMEASVSASAAVSVLSDVDIIRQAITNADDRPERSMFDRRDLAELTPITVSADGSIWGHLAPWNVPHVGIREESVFAPQSTIDYDLFHDRDVMTADGEAVRAGYLLVGCDHAPETAGVAEARAYHAQMCTPAAVVRAYEDQHGVQVAGALMPGLTEEHVAELEHLSGEWRSVQLELMAAVGVDDPGFPVASHGSGTVMTASQKRARAMVAHIPRRILSTSERKSLVADVIAEMERRQAARVARDEAVVRALRVQAASVVSRVDSFRR